MVTIDLSGCRGWSPTRGRTRLRRRFREYISSRGLKPFRHSIISEGLRPFRPPIIWEGLKPFRPPVISEGPQPFRPRIISEWSKAQPVRSCLSIVRAQLRLPTAIGSASVCVHGSGLDERRLCASGSLYQWRRITRVVVGLQTVPVHGTKPTSSLSTPPARTPRSAPGTCATGELAAHSQAPPA